MARTGEFGGFTFDPEVFADYMRQMPTWNNAIMASGILQEDASLMNLIGEKGNVASIPMYSPLSIEDDNIGDALNNDGQTDNTPVQPKGTKQTAMLIQRMKAFKAQDFTKELTGADPIGEIGNSVSDYYEQVWIKELMTIASAAMSIEDLSGHVTDLSSSGTEITDDNKIAADTLIYAEQAALGDMASNFGLIVMNSYIYARYKVMGLVDFNKYTITNAIEPTLELPTINGLIPIVQDRFTIDTTGDLPVYKTYLFGQGSILTCDKTNYEEPYYVDYDPESLAGVQKLYTKQGKVLHPNGLSLKVDNIAAESPTNAELGTTANWTLAADSKNVRIGLIKSNG